MKLCAISLPSSDWFEMALFCNRFFIDIKLGMWFNGSREICPENGLYEAGVQK